MQQLKHKNHINFKIFNRLSDCKIIKRVYNNIIQVQWKKKKKKKARTTSNLLKSKSPLVPLELQPLQQLPLLLPPEQFHHSPKSQPPLLLPFILKKKKKRCVFYFLGSIVKLLLPMESENPTYFPKMYLLAFHTQQTWLQLDWSQFLVCLIQNTLNSMILRSVSDGFRIITRRYGLSLRFPSMNLATFFFLLIIDQVLK